MLLDDHPKLVRAVSEGLGYPAKLADPNCNTWFAATVKGYYMLVAGERGYPLDIAASFVGRPPGLFAKVRSMKRSMKRSNAPAGELLTKLEKIRQAMRKELANDGQGTTG